MTNTDQTRAPEETIYAITSTHRHDGYDGRPTEDIEIEEDEGWFCSEESAQARVDQLNQALQRSYELDEDRNRREREKERRAAQHLNKEAEAIRAAGMKKADVKVPAPYTPRSFEQWARTKDSLTTHQVITLTRSEHDRIIAQVTADQKGDDS